MPRSSRHKSSKHSSRDYSDSEKDSILKERKPKEESGSHRVSREHASGEKRKYDSKVVDGKDVGGHGSVDFVQEYGGSSSKKRKEKVDDDRWTGGDADERELVKAEKDLKGLSDSKIRSRRGSSSGRAADVDEGKRSGSKGDSKHHKSERKERSEKEGGLERDRKGKEYSTNDRFVDGEVDIVGEGSRKKVVPLEDVADKHISSNSGAVSLDERRNHDHDRELERRSRRKDGSNDVDKYLDGKEVDDRRVSSRIETVKSVKYKDDGYEDRHKDKYGDDLEKDSRYQDEKQHHRDGRQARDYVSSRSAEKYVRDEKKDLDVQQKKSKPMDSDRDHSRSRHSRHHDDRDRDDRNRDIDLDRDGEHDGGRDLDRDRGRDLDHDRGRERDRDRGRDFDRDRDRERYRREHDRDRDYSSHLDERSSRYKEDRNRRRSPDDYDDYYTDKAKTSKADPHADREKSVSRRTHSEAVAGSTRRRTSPSYRSHMNVDKYRDNTHDDSKHGDSRQLLATPDKSSKYPSSDKNPKLDENYRAIDPSAERSPRKKTSPLKPLEKSPSTTSIDRKYANRSDRRRSLDVDEAERRSTGSNNVRDGSINDDRQSKDLSPKKSMGEEHSPVESSFHRKSSQVNGSFIGHGSSSYKAGADSPLIGSMGEDNRGHNNRYRRSVDPNPGRAHGNMWKGVPNWPTPMQSGFMPFPPGPHGPPHGVFPSVLPQFPSPPIFGIRPEMNHSGIPYHLPDADRFTNHMRPLGWQNMVDGTTPSHFPGWDANNGIYRDESSMYGPGCIPNGRVRETNADMWKQNGDVKSETGAKKDGNATENFTEANVTQTAQGSHIDNYQNEEQGIMKTPNGASINEALVDLTKVYDEKAPESPAVDDGPKILRAYLSSLDICVELTNPELYNEFVNLALVEQSDNFEDTEDADMGMPKDVVPEITNVTTDISLLPAAEDSIFQRALDLYKTHNVDRRSFCIFDGDVSNSPSASDMRVMDQGHGQEVTEKEMEEPIRYQEIQEQPVEEPVHYQEIQEQPVEEPVHYQEIKEQPVEEPASAAAQTEQMETEQVEQVETNTGDVSDDGVIDSPSCNVAVKEMASVENVSFKLSSGDVPISNTEDAEMGVAEDENENINVEQHGSEVSGPLSLPLDTVKVCEGLMPVSNDYESESVTITRVHDAPESTH